MISGTERKTSKKQISNAFEENQHELNSLYFMINEIFLLYFLQIFSNFLSMSLFKSVVDVSVKIYYSKL